MRLGLGHAGPVLLHLAVWADPDRRADHARGFLAVHHLLAPRGVAAPHLLVWIGEQREGKPVLAGEALVGLVRVRRDAEHDRPELADLLPGVPEAAGLLGASGRVVPRVEVEDHVLAREVRERDRVPVCVGQREGGRRLSYLERQSIPPRRPDPGRRSPPGSRRPAKRAGQDIVLPSRRPHRAPQGIVVTGSSFRYVGSVLAWPVLAAAGLALAAG